MEVKYTNGRVNYKKGVVVDKKDSFGQPMVQFEGDKIFSAGVPFKNVTVLD